MGAACSSIEKGSPACCTKVEDAKENGDDKGPKKRKSFKPEKNADAPSTAQSERNLQRSGSSLQPGDVKRSASTGEVKRSGSTLGMPGEQKPGDKKIKTDFVRYEKNLKRMKKVALEVSGELNHFSVFLKKEFANPSAAFDRISGSAKAVSVEMDKFIDHCQQIGFGGDEHKVFYGLCDDQAWGAAPIITRDAFVKRLGSMGNPFIQVVRQACLRDRARIKKNVAEAMMEKNRDPIMVEEFRKFIEPLFPTPGKCFDAIAGDDGNIDEDEFVEWLAGVNYQGDASKVFLNFCDTDGYITRLSFSNILVATNADSPTNAENPQDGEGNTAKRKKGRSSTTNTTNTTKTEEDQESPSSPQASAKKKGRRKSLTNEDVTEAEGGEEPDTAKKKPARRKSLSSLEGDETRAPAKPARRKSLSSVDGDETPSPAKPVRRKSLSSVQGDDAPAQDKEKTKTRRKSLSGTEGLPAAADGGSEKNAEASAKGKAKAKAKRRNSFTAG